MPSSSRGRGCGRRRQAERDWAEGMPMDALLEIFHRLDHADVLLAAGGVCRTWRRAARDEPSLWRRISMCSNEYDGLAGLRRYRYMLAWAALRWSAGQCEAFGFFCGGGDAGIVNEIFLAYLSKQAPCLKSLRLVSCNGITNKGLRMAVTGFPQLQEVEISLCKNIGGARVFKVVGKACPQLSCFSLNKQRFNNGDTWNLDRDAQGISNMHGLRSLQLFGNVLTNKGLVTILDNCPKLESLDIRHCFNINMMDHTLFTKCAGIRTLKLPSDEIDDYELQVKNPLRFLSRTPFWGL